MFCFKVFFWEFQLLSKSQYMIYCRFLLKLGFTMKHIFYLNVGINVLTLKHCCGIGTVHGESGSPCGDYTTPFPNVPKEDEAKCMKSVDVCCKNKFRENQCNLGQSDAMNKKECVSSEDASIDDFRKVFYLNQNEIPKIIITSCNFEGLLRSLPIGYGNGWDRTILYHFAWIRITLRQCFRYLL